MSKRVKRAGTDDPTDYKQDNEADYVDSQESGKLDTSWLAGKYPDINAEINTRLPYVAIDDWFFQGEDAEQTLEDIWIIWAGENLTVEEAILIYKSRYLISF